MVYSTTRKRELDSLDAAMARAGLAHGTVITLSENGEVALEHGTAHIVLAWRWLLDKDKE